MTTCTIVGIWEGIYQRTKWLVHRLMVYMNNCVPGSAIPIHLHSSCITRAKVVYNHAIEYIVQDGLLKSIGLSVHSLPPLLVLLLDQ